MYAIRSYYGHRRVRLCGQDRHVITSYSIHYTKLYEDYPIDKKLAVCGDLSSSVNEAVQTHGVDLLICGHHQTFWSLLTSSARQLMNSVRCDLLVVPLEEEEEEAPATPNA